MSEEYGHIPDGFFLSDKEVEDLRKSKKELTEYGKQKLRALMTEPIHAKVSDEDFQKIVEAFDNPQPYPDEMFEEAERREAERKALDALDKLYEENGDAMTKLAEIEKDNWEREQKRQRVLERYNHYYNMECASLPHGTPITPEHQQMITLQSMIDALRCENLNHEFDVVPTADIEDLIEGLRNQANGFLKRVEEFKDSADGVA